jgi:hypothetical protein
LIEGVGAPSKKKILDAMALYLGSVDYASVRDQERLHRKALALVQKMASKHGMSADDVWNQAEAAARKRGIIKPIPGQHI